MFCSNCGKEIIESSKFCTNCGNSLEGYIEEKCSITFERENQVYGVLIPIKVFLDGKEVASIGTGNSQKIVTTPGNHRIAFNLWSGNGQYDVEIKNENPNIKVLFKLGIGAVTSKPKIVSITNI